MNDELQAEVSSESIARSAWGRKIESRGLGERFGFEGGVNLCVRNHGSEVFMRHWWALFRWKKKRAAAKQRQVP